MKPIICTDVWRDEGSPLYTVKVYDEDEMVAKVAASCNIEDYTVIRWY